MPQKQEAEEEYYEMMDGCELNIEIVLAKMSGLSYKTTPQQYMDTYYTDIVEIMADGTLYDGLIVTGAPLEHLDYEDVIYWQQLHDVYRWTFSNVRSTLNICWGAFAALRIFFGIDKHWTEHKLFGVYTHILESDGIPLTEGLPREVNVPISRHITLFSDELRAEEQLTILLDQNETGPELAIAWGGRHIFANGHMEYAEGRLRFEYERDMTKGVPIDVPFNYFYDNNPQLGVNVSWQESGKRFYHNWLRYYVGNKDMQITPTEVEFKY